MIKETLLAIALLTGGYLISATEPPTIIEQVVTVEQGDTLWDICSRIATNKDDLQKIVYETMIVNNINDASNLKAGEKILVRIERY